jgi:hypothetical protein
MKSPLTQPISPEISEQWRARLEVLEHYLRDAPGDEQAWLWEIQWYIIAYLLGRYAGQEIETRPNPAISIPRPVLPVREPSPVLANIRPSIVPTALPGMGKSPRSCVEIRRCLQTISNGNLPQYFEPTPGQPTLTEDQIVDLLSEMLENELENKLPS